MNWFFIYGIIIVGFLIAYEREVCEIEETIEWCLSHPIKVARNVKKYRKEHSK